MRRKRSRLLSINNMDAYKLKVAETNPTPARYPADGPKPFVLLDDVQHSGDGSTLMKAAAESDGGWRRMSSSDVYIARACRRLTVLFV